MEVAMGRDIKEVVGILMRVLDGGEVTLDELNHVSFDAEGALEDALNAATIKLREFASDRELRLGDRKLDRAMRAELQDCLDRIVRACDRDSRMALRDAMSKVA
jgi:hypothetical protein